MGTMFTRLEPDDLVSFKNLPQTNSLLQTIEIPERDYNRKKTDVKWLWIFFVVVILLMPFLIYTLANSNINVLIHGYDECGNVCGQENDFYSYSCSGKDFSSKPYFQLGNNFRRCVEKCDSDQTAIFYLCAGRNNELDQEEQKVFDDLGGYLSNKAWNITWACLLSVAISLGMLFLFRTATAAVVWGILGGVMVLGAILVGACWYFYMNMNEISAEANQKSSMLVLSIFLTVIWLVLFCVMVFMYRRIQLVVQLLKEATKAAFAIPQLFLVPIVTMVAFLIVLILLVTTSFYMFSAGKFVPVTANSLEYEMTPIMVFTLLFNFWTAFWAIQFILGFQYMVIGGAISKWYFARDKSNLESPVLTSTRIAFKFHLGSIAFGSMIITLIAIIRAIIQSLIKNRNFKVCMDCCFKNLETFIKFLSKNAYIITAMHGTPFFKSGKRAAQIILQNAVNIIVINNIGDFVLAMAQLLIVLITMLLTVGLIEDRNDQHAFIIYIIVFFVSVFVATTFFAIFESTIDTIFLCFCEDSLLNDGMARPYAMSRGLMEFVENSKKVLPKKE